MPARRELYERMTRWRRLWIARGYAGATKQKPSGPTGPDLTAMLASLRSVFNHPGLRRFLVRLRVPLAIVAIVVAVPFLQARVARRRLPRFDGR